MHRHFRLPATAKVLLLACVFLCQLVSAMALHLDTAVARRCIERWTSSYLSNELRGALDIGQIEKLTPSTAWLKNVAIYDAQQRRVATIDRVRAHSTLAGALYRWVRKRENLTMIVESLRADGIHLRLHSDSNSVAPSLLTAIELDPNRAHPSERPTNEPFRLSFPHIELGEVSIDSTLPNFVTSSIHLRQVSGQLHITERGTAISIHRFSFDMAEPIAAPLHAFGTLEYRSPDRIWGDVNATIADTPIAIHLDYKRGQLESTIHLPEVQPSHVTRSFPSWPLRVPVTLTVKTNGPLENLAVTFEAASGSTRLEAVGTIHRGTQYRADLVLVGEALNLEALLGNQFPSSLSGTAKVTAIIQDGVPSIHWDGVLHPGHLAQVATPQIDFQGDYDAEGTMLSGRSTDRNLPIRAAVAFRDQAINIDAQVDGVALEHLLPGDWKLPCTGVLSARGRAQIREGDISGKLDATMRDVAISSGRIARANAAIEFSGPVREPADWSGDVALSAVKVVTPYASLSRVAAHAIGDRRKAHITLTAEEPSIVKVQVESDMSLSDRFSLRGTKIELRRGTTSLALSASQLAFSDDSLLLDGLAVDGSAGHLSGSLGFEGGHVFGRIAGNELDLGVISDLLNLPQRFVAGRASIDIDADTRPTRARSHARVAFERATVGWVTNLSGHIEVNLNQDELEAESQLGSDLIDAVQASVQAKLGGPPTHVSSYRDAVGSAELRLSSIRLDRIGTLLGALKNGLELSGTADLRLGVSRLTANESPTITVGAQTQQLSLLIPLETSSLRLKGADMQCSATLLSETGALQIDGLFAQRAVPKATLHLVGTLPPMAHWGGNIDVLRSGWQSFPFELVAAAPLQRVEDSANLFGRTMGTGEAEFKLWVRGPLREARIVADVRGKDLILKSIGNSIAFDVQGLAEFAQNSGEARLLLAAGSHDKTWVQVNGIGTVLPCAQSFGCIRDWAGRVEVGLLGLPLQVLPVLGPLGFTGEMRGVLSARRQDGTTSVDGVLPVDNFRVSGHPLGQTLLHLRGDGESLIAGAKLMDGGAQIDFEAHVPVEWRHLIPSLRNELPLHFVARATGYDVGIFAPWVDDYATDLEGELDGSVEATYSLSQSLASASVPHLALGGRIGLKNGSARVRALGVVLNDLSVDAHATSTATRSTFTISKFASSIGDGPGHISGSAMVELEGLKFRRVAAQIDEAKDVPIIANTTTLATANGKAKLELTPSANGYDIDVNFEALEVRLPRSNTRQVVGLTEHPDIVVIQPLGSQAWRQSRAAKNGEFRLRLALGNKASVTRSDFTLPISGTPEITANGHVRPSGRIQLEPGGRLHLFGKVFVVDHGSLTFDPEQPNNPKLDVTATWRGPTHLVTANIQGKREEARLRLSSDPALSSEAQVMALLLGGGVGNDSTATAGLGVGASLFNEVLSDTALSTLELRTSTDDRHANYTAAVPLRENLWFEATYQSPNNTNLPGSSSQRGFSGTVDYRFRRNWSVRTEVGTLGAGADLLWQYRY